MSKYYRLISFLLGVLILFLVLDYIGFNAVLKTLEKINPRAFILYIVFSIFCSFIDIYRWNVILENEGIFVPYIRLIIYKFSGYFVNFLTPLAQAGGEPVAALLLSKNHRIPYKKSFGITSFDRIIEFTSQVIFVCVSIIFILFEVKGFAKKITYHLLSGTIATLILIFLFFIWLKYRWKKRKNGKYIKPKKEGIIEYIAGILDVLHNTTVHFRSILPMIAFLTLSKYLFQFVQYYYLVKSIHDNVSIATLFAAVITVSVSYTIPVPGAIGSMTAIPALGLKAVKVSAEKGAVIGLIVQTKDFIFASVGFIFLLTYGVSHLSSIDNEYIKEIIFSGNRNRLSK